jgi:hypothetical protein
MTVLHGAWPPNAAVDFLALVSHIWEFSGSSHSPELALLIEIVCSFPQYFQAKAGIVP